MQKSTSNVQKKKPSLCGLFKQARTSFVLCFQRGLCQHLRELRQGGIAAAFGSRFWAPLLISKGWWGLVVLLTLGWGGCPNSERPLSSLPSGGRLRSALGVQPVRPVRCKGAEMAASRFALSRVALEPPQATCVGASVGTFWAGVDYTCLLLCLQVIAVCGICHRITEWLGLEGTSAGRRGPCPGGSWISPEKETPQPPWAAWARAPSPSEGGISSF